VRVHLEHRKKYHSDSQYIAKNHQKSVCVDRCNRFHITHGSGYQIPDRGFVKERRPEVDKLVIQPLADVPNHILGNEIGKVNQEKVENRFRNHQSDEHIDVLHQLGFIFQLDNVDIHNIFCQNWSVCRNHRQKNRNNQGENKPRTEFHPDQKKSFYNVPGRLLLHFSLDSIDFSLSKKSLQK